MSPRARERIRNIRKAAGLTAQEAADKADMHPVFWSDIERGKTENPTLDTLKRMAAALGVGLADFLDERRGLGSRCSKCGEPMVCTGRKRFGAVEEGFGGSAFRTEYEEYACPACEFIEWGAIGKETIAGDDLHAGIARRIRLPGDYIIELGVADGGFVTLSTQVKDGPVATMLVPLDEAKELSTLLWRFIEIAENEQPPEG